MERGYYTFKLLRYQIRSILFQTGSLSRFQRFPIFIERFSSQAKYRKRRRNNFGDVRRRCRRMENDGCNNGERDWRFERPSRRREENDVRPAVDSDRRRARPDWLLSARPLSLVRRASSPSASSSHSQSPTPASTRWRGAHEPHTRENDSKKEGGAPSPNSIDRTSLLSSPFFQTTFSFSASYEYSSRIHFSPPVFR